LNDKNIQSVSVVIPCLNAQNTIEVAIESARRQLSIDVQIICVNDNSQDETPQMLSQFAAKGLIQYIDSSTSGNAAITRNLGLKYCRSDYIQFLDADDELHAGKLSRQANIMAKTSADIVAGTYQLNHLNGGNSIISPDKDCWHGLIISRLGKTSANLFRKSALNAIKGWSHQQKSSQEYQLMFNLLQQNANVALDTVVGTTINATHGSISQSNQTDNAIRFIELRTRIIEYLRHTGQLTDSQQASYKMICDRSIAELKKTR
jgi:glycosyltransferase involved in cell wall biosynthesis